MTWGMREALIVLIALIALYMLFVVLRMRHLRRHPVSSSQQEPAPAIQTPAGQKDTAGMASSEGETAVEPEVDQDAAPLHLAEEVLRSGVEQELAQLRDEVDAVRGELAALRADMQHELASLRACQTVSPIYGDAMQLAVSGYDAAAIAERCGIARAEADLVVALAKSQER